MEVFVPSPGTSPTSSSFCFENHRDLRLYFHEKYRRWTVDVLKPSQVARKTFQSKDQAIDFARNKLKEVV